MNGVKIGEGTVTVMAGPCAVESEEQVMTAAHAVKERGASMLRGGAFKPRTSPYSFRGLEDEGLKLLAQARAETGLPVVTEVMSESDRRCRRQVRRHPADRHTQRAELLPARGGRQDAASPSCSSAACRRRSRSGCWRRSTSSRKGNRNVILCERGIRTFETATRNTMDINAVPLIKELSHLPIIADPSHGTGKRKLVEPVALGMVAAGADGLILEVHPSPEHALSDGAQSLDFDMFASVMANVSEGRGGRRQAHRERRRGVALRTT